MNPLTQKTAFFFRRNKAMFIKIYIPFLLVFAIFNFVSSKLSVKITSIAQEMMTSMPFGDFSPNKLISLMKNELPILLLIATALALVKFVYNCLIISTIAKNSGKLLEKPRFPSFAALFATFLLYELMRWFGFALFVIPGIILSFYLLMVPCVLVMENKTNFVSFDRSFFIIKKDTIHVLNAVLTIGIAYFLAQFVFSLTVSFVQIILKGIITIFSLNAAASILNGIFMFLDIFVSSALYAIFSILIQSMLFIHYTEQVDQTKSGNQAAFEEQKYTLDDYYRAKEEPDDDDEQSS